MSSRVATIILFLLAALLWLSVPQTAAAQSCSATISNVDFGAPDLLSTSATDAMATVTVTCTGIPLFSVVKMCPSIGAGSGGSSGSSRLLRSGSSTLAYQLFQDAGRTSAWGSLTRTELGTVPAILLGGGLATRATVTRTIYARLFGSQSSAPPGSYLSTFSTSETAFTHSTFFAGATSSCDGFVGASVIYPTFQISAAPTAGCTLTTSDLDFGSVGVLTGAVAAQSQLRLACTRNTPFAVGLDNGVGGTGPTARKMTTTAGQSVAYGLYRDPARTQPWGDASGNRLSGQGAGTTQTHIIYGQVPAQTTPPPGAYSDRVVATVTY